MIHSRPLLLAALLITASGCFSGKKRPLFGGADEDQPAGPRLGTDPIGGPARSDPGVALKLRTAPVDQLLDKLRAAGVGGPKRAVLQELLRRGPSAKPLVREALDEEQVLIDLLRELGRRLDVAPRKGGGRVKAAWVREKYRLALDRYAAGDLYGALRVIDAIFALEPDTAMGGKLRRLRRRCTDRLMRDGLLRAEIEFVGEGRVLATSAALKVRVRLTNVSRERIVLEVDERRARALGVLSLDYEELSHTGTRTRLRTQHKVAAPSRELSLGPGQARTLEAKLPSPHRKLTPGLVGRYHVSGWLRAQSMRVGETTYPGFVPLLPRRRLAVGPDDLEVSKAPVARFKEECAKARKGTHQQRLEPARRAFVAAVVWGQTDREAALKGLIAALDQATRPPLSAALCAALGRVSGEPLSFTRHEWLMWWAERESRPSRRE